MKDRTIEFMLVAIFGVLFAILINISCIYELLKRVTP